MLETYEEPKFCPYRVLPKQAEFLSSDKLEVLFGGGAGGGKSTALLMAATQYLHIPDYRAIIFRKHYVDLALPGALVEKSMEWFYGQPGVKWSEANHRWTFPSGATLEFSYLYKPNDHLRYLSKSYQFIGFDHLDVIREKHYRYMASRLKRLLSEKVPLRLWSTATPEDGWVRKRFLETPDANRTYISANILDNREVDYLSYLNSLEKLSLKERRRLIHGDWYWNE